ncbi:hypothetical protein RJ640_030928 [Escallonia rubra]|uniref:WRC domain-containing protein n=1 Tax=Escallonia rubra TaxID=112253 RepID=A0AA88R650_9ASTE|nr:hypothetical protein RJ640_030928 [Escallonia rubra]
MRTHGSKIGGSLLLLLATRVWYDPSAETSTGSSSCSSSSPHEGHWFEEDKIFSLKKRRVSIESNGARAMELKRKNIHVKQRTSKCISEKSIDGDYIVAKNGAKEVMEGVRCSRRNGRGWRCCQPTVVGFSGCEHHPDLERLRPKGKRLSAGNAVSQQPSCSATAFSPETVASPEKLLRLLERLSSWSPEDSPATMSMARLLFMGGELGGHSLGALQQQAQ